MPKGWFDQGSDPEVWKGWFDQGSDREMPEGWFHQGSDPEVSKGPHGRRSNVKCRQPLVV
ncbi:MAG: uncharacterized protein KVP18_003224 [Porospora cf. gigantea A]|uniref:uncharacterized protein n=1 Tax=Porospora cf. gigantea A TaxID=2853593 RepID=UPI0035594E32|nr:MAG: hypothetical protein KVP18_003224 [Porospora cf. gigantea A]